MSKLRIFADDFPTPTSVSVDWQEAGVVFFVDICRSAFELAPPSIWMMQPSSGSSKTNEQDSSSNNNNYNNNADDDDDDDEKIQPSVVSTLAVSPSSVQFRCTSFVPMIANNVLILLIGDASVNTGSVGGGGSPAVSSSTATSGGATKKSSSSHHLHQSAPSGPFFGVCASLLPPPKLVAENGSTAFTSFSFAWLCGPGVTSMRPAARVGFSSCFTSASYYSSSNYQTKHQQQQNQQNQNQQQQPNYSIWIHGGVPCIPKPKSGGSYRSSQQTTTTNSSNELKVIGGSGGSHIGESSHEPIGIVPEPNVADSDTFVVSSENSGDRYLRKAVAEDFYSLFELKLYISSVDENVSVWPWNRRSGLPMLCYHSLCSTMAIPNFFQQNRNSAVDNSPGTPHNNNYDNNNVSPTRNSSSSKNNNNTLYLVAFGGLRLNLWRSQRADLLPFNNTEFVVSNAFFIFDVARDMWEWRDSLAGTELATSDAVEGGFPIVGPRPPPVFEHRMISSIDYSSSSQSNSNNSQYYDPNNNGDNNTNTNTNNNNGNHAYFITGGLRGRFAEKSKELWCFSPQLPKHIECCQQTAPPCIPSHVFSYQLVNEREEFPRLWAVDIKNKRLWHRRASIVETGESWLGPFPIVNGAERSRSIDLDNPPPTIVHIPQQHSPTTAKNQSAEEDDTNKPSSSSAFSNVGESKNDNLGDSRNRIRLGAPNSDNNNGDNDDDGIRNREMAAGYSSSSPTQQKQQHGAPSPRTSALMMDAFEFG